MTTTEPTNSQALADEALAQLGEIDLSGAPELRPALGLRARVKAKFVKVQQHMSEVDPEDAAANYELIGDMDEALELLAVDRRAWIAFAAEEDNYRKVAALFVKAVQQMGESARSAS